VCLFGRRAVACHSLPLLSIDAQKFKEQFLAAMELNKSDGKTGPSEPEPAGEVKRDDAEGKPEEKLVGDSATPPVEPEKGAAE